MVEECRSWAVNDVFCEEGSGGDSALPWVGVSAVLTHRF